MAIKNFPRSIYKTKVPAIDRELAKRTPITVSGNKNMLPSGLDVTISSNADWQLDSIAFNFSNANAKNYYAQIKNGRKVVTKYNDSLWFWHRGAAGSALPQLIFLDAGFYTGAQLATHLQTKMNANTAWTALGTTFSVTYNATTGLFTIGPNAGEMRYLDDNSMQSTDIRQSFGGHLLGFNVDSAVFATTITSDTQVAGLNTETPIISQVASVATGHYHDDIHTLSIDQALHLQTNNGVATIVNYTVVYEEMV